MSDPDSNRPQHPGLTLRIYRVSPQTMRRSEPRLVQLAPDDGPMLQSAFPPCSCPRCKRRDT